MSCHSRRISRKKFYRRRLCLYLWNIDIPINQLTFKVSGAYSNTIELEDANTTNFKHFEDDGTARLARVITSFDTRKQQESVRIYNNFDVSGSLDLKNGIVFSGDDSALKFKSKASINLWNNTRKRIFLGKRDV